MPNDDDVYIKSGFRPGVGRNEDLLKVINPGRMERCIASKQSGIAGILLLID